jgi:hypothetical protein
MHQMLFKRDVSIQSGRSWLVIILVICDLIYSVKLNSVVNDQFASIYCKRGDAHKFRMFDRDRMYL